MPDDQRVVRRVAAMGVFHPCPPRNPRSEDEGSAQQFQSAYIHPQCQGGRTGNVPSVIATEIAASTRDLPYRQRLATEIEPFATEHGFLPAESRHQALARKFESDRLIIARDATTGDCAGFVATSQILTLDRTGLKSIYIEGTLVAPKYAGFVLAPAMQELAPFDLIALHTQSPRMYAAARKLGSAAWPQSGDAAPLRPELFLDVAEMMTVVGRPRPVAPDDARVKGMYSHVLYARRPSPRTENVPDVFSHLDDVDAVLVLVGRTSKAAELLANTPQSAGGGR